MGVAREVPGAPVTPPPLWKLFFKQTTYNIPWRKCHDDIVWHSVTPPRPPPLKNPGYAPALVIASECLSVALSLKCQNKCCPVDWFRSNHANSSWIRLPVAAHVSKMSRCQHVTATRAIVCYYVSYYTSDDHWDPQIRTLSQAKSKLRAQKSMKTANCCNCKIRKSVKILLWIRNPGENTFRIRRSVSLFTPLRTEIYIYIMKERYIRKVL